MKKQKAEQKNSEIADITKKTYFRITKLGEKAHNTQTPNSTNNAL